MYEEQNGVTIDVKTYTELVLAKHKLDIILKAFYHSVQVDDGIIYPGYDFTHVVSLVDSEQYNQVVREKTVQEVCGNE